ncbi:MAG: OsmC family protein [Magnetospiraceae bacterium]
MTRPSADSAASAAPALSPRDESIRTHQNTVIERMRQDLAAAQNTIVTTGRVADGLACNIAQGDYSAIADMGQNMGGDAAGPSPGFYARAGIVSCVAIGVKMLAAREGLTFRSVEVIIENDFDDAALMGLSARTAAPYATRLRIAIDTDVEATIVNDLVDRALATDPWYLALRDAQVVDHSVALTRNP